VAAQYELIVRGRLGHRLGRAIQGFHVVSSGGGRTRLLGWVRTQEELHTALRAAHDLGIDVLEIALVREEGSQR
jgi:hypothetical protein